MRFIWNFIEQNFDKLIVHRRHIKREKFSRKTLLDLSKLITTIIILTSFWGTKCALFVFHGQLGIIHKVLMENSLFVPIEEQNTCEQQHMYICLTFESDDEIFWPYQRNHWSKHILNGNSKFIFDISGSSDASNMEFYISIQYIYISAWYVPTFRCVTQHSKESL